MPCMCIRKLSDFLQSLKNLPLNLLAELIPPCPAQLSTLGALASGVGTMQALASASVSASARAQLAAALHLGLPPFPFPALDLGKLEAMAFLAGTTGTNAFSAKASLQLTSLTSSINVHLPSVMQLLMELLQPLTVPLMDLLALIGACEAVQATFGVNLTLPGAMLQLRAALAARVGLHLAATATMTASAELVANLASLGSYARLINAAAALGFNLALPGMALRFSAALQVALGLPIPPLNVDLPQMNTLANLLAALTPLQRSVFGINLRLPGAWKLLALALRSLMVNLEESLNLAATATAMASLSETARLGSQLSAVPPVLGLGVSLRAMLHLNLQGWPLPQLPNLGALAAAARLGASTGLNVFANTPCSASCPVGKTL